MSQSSELTSYDPATGDAVGSVPVTAVEAIPGLVARAREAQATWASMGASDRAELIGRCEPVFEARAEELGELMTREMGKPLARSMGEIRACGRSLRAHLDEIVDALASETLETETVRSVIHRDPLGVCAAITPWNYPMSMPHWMVVPALMAGNTVVLKPSEETPLVGQAYVDILNEVLPDGVLQVVHGADDQGRALVDADVDLIAFTGSREVGKLIMQAAGRGLKRLVLELGGKDPMIVLDDADLDLAAEFAAKSSYDNSGQMCVSTERIFVPEPLVDAFVERLVAQTRGLTVGPGLDESSDLGPMVNRRQRDHVVRQMEAAVADGADLAWRGDRDDGNFVSPTVLTGVRPEMAIAREETFGPVACVIAVADEEEAVRLANDSPFGLGAVVFGRDERRAHDVARRLTAGMIGVNRGVGGAPGTPWVGARESGFAFHKSRDGHRYFTQTRVVSSPVAG